MKVALRLFLVFFLVIALQSVVLLDKRVDKGKFNKDRKLLVTPGFNEVEATENYKAELKEMIERVYTLQKQLSDFQQETIRDVNSVVQKLNAQTDKNALDSTLNKLFISAGNNLV